MSRCRVSRAAGLGQDALTTRYAQIRAKPPGREGPGKQTSHQLTWKVNRPGGRRPLEAGWARERCGSRPSLSSRLGESTGQARRHGFETRWHGQPCEIRVLGSPPISVDQRSSLGPPCGRRWRRDESCWGQPLEAGCRSGNQARADEPSSGECHQRVHARLPTRYARALVELPRWPLPRVKSGVASAAPDQVHILRTRVQIALLQPFTGRLGIGEPKAL